MAKTHSKSSYKIFTRLVFLTAITGSLLSIWLISSVNALLLTSRSIQVSTAVPLATASHDFQFTYGSTTTLGSVVLEYCDNSPIFSVSCTAPTGLNVDPANLTSQTGNTGFSIDGVNTIANKIVLTRSASAAAAVPSTYSFSSITNPSSSNQTTFVRISTYASVDGSGAFTDGGAVAFATHTAFNVSTDVPPFIKFCVGVSVAVDCTSAAGNSLNLGNLSTTSANTSQSQFASGTNSITGYNVFLLGTTMTSGVNIIPALGSPSISQPGASQFGINLRANSNPSVGQNPSGSGSANPTPDYNGVNLFKFSPGDTLVSAALPSDFNRMTVSYLVNVSSSQNPGVYATTITYLATADF